MYDRPMKPGDYIVRPGASNTLALDVEKIERVEDSKVYMVGIRTPLKFPGRSIIITASIQDFVGNENN